ncbi:MAG: SIMPL domain-containing protein [Candidatus Shapirobacteria bacterium]|nr:SIMPL domain-containing protein [Candidatus Shapirobacteria bacterium]MDD4410284.1 SIMPL domain-containing protein [Candidatus Shapirobacteria bacterium]
MKENNNKAVGILILVIIAAFVLPWRNINWGKINFGGETVVVTGESETKQKNEVASFSAGVNVIKENKEEAIAEVNKKISDLITSVKDFGIAEADIQTQSANVYEQQETDKTKKNNWIVNNTIEITLRDVSKANELMDLLNKSGANNVYGPSFRIEDTKTAEKTLYEAAMTDAKERAELIAKASGRKLGKVMNVVEGNSGVSYSLYKAALSSGAGGADLQTGTSTISKTLTVTFELK